MALARFVTTITALLLLRAKAEDPRSCLARCDASVDMPAKFRGKGTIYIVQPNLGLTGGGSLTMHQIHEVLLDLGYTSRMHMVNPKFATSKSVNMSGIELTATASRGLGSEDAMLVPELAEFGDTVIAKVQAKGGVIVRYFLGLHRYFDTLDRRGILHVAISKFIRRHLIGCVGPVLGPPPLEASIYKKAAAAEDRNRDKNVQPRVVLVDDDVRVDDVDLQKAVDAVKPETVRIVKFQGFDRPTTIDLFKNASVFFDGYHPGMERALWEAALFDVVPLAQRVIHGASEEDLPLESIPRFETGSNIAEAIVQTALNWETLHKKLGPIQEEARMWPHQYTAALTTIFDSRHFHVHTVVTGAAQDDTWLLPLLISSLCVAPLAGLVVHTDAAWASLLQNDTTEATYWRRMHLGPGAYDLLDHLGLLTRLTFAPLAQDDDLRRRRSMGLHVPPQSLLLDSRILPCGATALSSSSEDDDDDVSQVVAFFQGDDDCYHQFLGVPPVAVLAATSEERHLISKVAQDGWSTIVENPGIVHLRTLADPVIFVAADPTADVSTVLRNHPLWQTFLPLFHSNVRRRLIPGPLN